MQKNTLFALIFLHFKANDLAHWHFFWIHFEWISALEVRNEPASEIKQNSNLKIMNLVFCFWKTKQNHLQSGRLNLHHLWEQNHIVRLVLSLVQQVFQPEEVRLHKLQRPESILGHRWLVQVQTPVCGTKPSEHRTRWYGIEQRRFQRLHRIVSILVQWKDDLVSEYIHLVSHLN